MEYQKCPDTFVCLSHAFEFCYPNRWCSDLAIDHETFMKHLERTSHKGSFDYYLASSLFDDSSSFEICTSFETAESLKPQWIVKLSPGFTYEVWKRKGNSND